MDDVINPQNNNFNQILHGKFWCSPNTTNQPKSTVELGYMCPLQLSGPSALTPTKKLKNNFFFHFLCTNEENMDTTVYELNILKSFKMTGHASDLLIFFQLFIILWTEFNETWQEARSQCRVPSLCFVHLIGKPRFSTSPLELPNRIKKNWTRMWHIVIRCTKCGPFGHFFEAYPNPILLCFFFQNTVMSRPIFFQAACLHTNQIGPKRSSFIFL